MNPTHFLHSVYFYGRENATSEDIEQLKQGCRALATIPGVLRITVGTPAGTPRPVVDNTYAVSLTIEFADQAAHDIYQTHPDHERFVDVHKHLWQRVQVYDALIEVAP